MSQPDRHRVHHDASDAQVKHGSNDHAAKVAQDKGGHEKAVADQKTENQRLRAGGKSGITHDFGNVELVEDGKSVLPKRAQHLDGEMSWTDGKALHKYKVEDGQIYDSKHHCIGIIEKDGKIDVFSKDNQHLNDKGHHLVFRGEDSQSHIRVDIASHEGQRGLCGKFTRPDGKQSYDVVDGYIFDGNKLVGRMDDTGKVQLPPGDKRQADAATDVNALLNRWKFEGTEDGHRRVFACNPDASNGSIHIPKEQLPRELRGTGDSKEEAFKIENGMLINSRGEQVGFIKPPDTAHGALAGGQIQWWGHEHAQPLKDFAGATFSLKPMGESGYSSCEIKGVCLGKDAAGSGLYDVQAAVQDQAHIKENNYQKSQERNQENIFQQGWGELSGDHAKQKQQEQKQDQQADKEIKKLDGLTNHTVDAATLGQLKKHEADAAKQKAEAAHKQAEQQKSEKQASPEASKKAHEGADKHSEGREKPASVPEPKKLELPKIVPGKTDGHLRIDHDVYDIVDGKLYRVHENAEHKRERDKSSCGEIGAGYTAKIDGVGTIKLADENRVLMEFSVDGGPTQRVVGLGKPRTSTGSDGTPKHMAGGLVSVNSLNKEVAAAAKETQGTYTDYLKSRTITSGMWDTLASGGGQSATPEQIMQRMSEKLDEDEQLLHRQVEKMFKNGFDPEAPIGSLDSGQRVLHGVMTDCHVTSQDSASISQDVQRAYKQADEAAAMAVMTVATAGTGALISGATNAGRLAFLGKNVHSVALAARIGAGALTGSAVKVGMGYHEGITTDEVMRTAGQGAVEGATMSVPGLAQGFKRAQDLRRGLQVSGALVADGATATASGARIADAAAVAAADGTMSATDLALMQGKIGQVAAQVGESKIGNILAEGTAVLADNAIQSTGFAAASQFRPEAQPVTAEQIALGTLFGAAAHGAGGAFGESGFMKSFNKGGLGKEFNLGELAENTIKGASSQMANGFVSGGLNELQPAIEEERARIAKEHGKRPEDIDDKTLWKEINIGTLIGKMSESGAISGLGSLGAGGLPGSLESAAQKHLTPKDSHAASHSSSDDHPVSESPSAAENHPAQESQRSPENHPTPESQPAPEKHLAAESLPTDESSHTAAVPELLREVPDLVRSQEQLSPREPPQSPVIEALDRVLDTFKQKASDAAVPYFEQLNGWFNKMTEKPSDGGPTFMEALEQACGNPNDASMEAVRSLVERASDILKPPDDMSSKDPRKKTFEQFNKYLTGISECSPTEAIHKLAEFATTITRNQQFDTTNVLTILHKSNPFRQSILEHWRGSNQERDALTALADARDTVRAALELVQHLPGDGSEFSGDLEKEFTKRASLHNNSFSEDESFERFHNAVNAVRSREAILIEHGASAADIKRLKDAFDRVWKANIELPKLDQQSISIFKDKFGANYLTEQDPSGKNYKDVIAAVGNKEQKKALKDVAEALKPTGKCFCLSLTKRADGVIEVDQFDIGNKNGRFKGYRVLINPDGTKSTEIHLFWTKSGDTPPQWTPEDIKLKPSNDCMVPLRQDGIEDALADLSTYKNPETRSTEKIFENGKSRTKTVRDAFIQGVHKVYGIDLSHGSSEAIAQLREQVTEGLNQNGFDNFAQAYEFFEKRYAARSSTK